MLFKSILALAPAGLVAAQSLSDALASQNSTLSTLNSLLLSQPDIVNALNQASNVTILAPSNDALTRFLNNSQAAAAAANPATLAAILSYHVLNGTYYASNLTATNRTNFIRTALIQPAYANVTGGQRVQALAQNGTVRFYSGLFENSTVTATNVNFTGGTIHIVDRVLSIPRNISTTLVAANLTSAVGALTTANEVANLTNLHDVTIFVPSNAGFNAIGNLVPNLTTAQLDSILRYHVVPNTLAYSSGIRNGTVQSLGGGNLTISVIGDSVFVNSAKVIVPDVLVANGVVHIIDNVLNPANTTATANPSATSNAPAFSGAATGTAGTPFTSGVQTPTSTAPVATRAPTSSSTGAAAPVRTGAIGAAALFGGAAVLANW